MQRGMSVAVLRVASLLRMVRMTVVMMVIMAWAIEMLRHGPILRAPRRWRSLLARLLRSLTLPVLECIDAPPNGCDHETSISVCWCAGRSLTGDLRSAS